MASDGIVGPGQIPGGTSGTGAFDTKISFTRGSIKYDSPFLDMTSNFIPRTIKGILRFLAASMLTDGLVSQTIIKMSEYPITDLIYNDAKPSNIKDDKTIEKWTKILEKKMKIMPAMKQIGMDYHGYGNSIVSINYPFKRMLRCKTCKKSDDVAVVVGLKYRNFKYEGDCRHCKKHIIYESYDLQTNELDKLNFIFWDLFYIHIKFNNISGNHFYYYEIPPNIKTAIRRGDLDIINTTKLEVIEAVRKRKKLKLKEDNIFHFKRSGPQYFYPSERGWGLSALLPVMKEIFHNKILKKGNEMIAFDHIVPLRLLFPQGTGDVSPHSTIPLANWRTSVEDEIRKWKADPNYISIMPLPVGQINFSGDAKLLSITPEIKATEDAIITGIGIIPEIIRGGASWSGSNVSLRVVENSFLNHRVLMDEFLEWVVDNVGDYFKMAKIGVKLSDFKMADDIQRKNMMIQASQQPAGDRTISRTTALKELDLDPKEEYDNIKDELEKAIELRVEQMKGDAEAQGEASVINSIFTADSENEYKSRMERHARDDQSKRDETRMQEQESNAQELFNEIANNFLTQNVKDMPSFIFKVTQNLAVMRRTDPEEFSNRMLAIKNSLPLLYNEIYENMKEKNVIEADLAPDMATIQQNTPGEVPTYQQGDTMGQGEPSPAEYGLDISSINVTNNKPAQPPMAQPQKNGVPNSLPEARPPKGKSAPI